MRGWMTLKHFIVWSVWTCLAADWGMIMRYSSIWHQAHWQGNALPWSVVYETYCRSFNRLVFLLSVWSPLVAWLSFSSAVTVCQMMAFKDWLHLFGWWRRDWTVFRSWMFPVSCYLPPYCCCSTNITSEFKNIEVCVYYKHFWALILFLIQTTPSQRGLSDTSHASKNLKNLMHLRPI